MLTLTSSTQKPVQWLGYTTLSREDILEKDRKDYYLLMDEFSMFSAQSEEALARMLSLARKYRLFVTMAHQTWSQLSERLQGALQNSIPVYFRLGYDDAVWAAPRLGHADPYHVKHEVKPLGGKDLGMEYHPVYFAQQEEYEKWTRSIENLWPQEAYVRVSRHIPFMFRPFFKRSKTRKIRTTRIPPPKVSQGKLTELLEAYARTLLRPLEGEMTQSIGERGDSPSGSFYESTEVFPGSVGNIVRANAKGLLKRAVGLGDSPKARKHQSVRTTLPKQPKRSGGEQSLVLILDQESRLGELDPARNSGLLSRLQDRGHQASNSRRSRTIVGGVSSSKVSR